MDSEKYLEIIRSGNTENLVVALKELLSLPDTVIEKSLFDLIYDLKFHKDFGVKFWANKALNKFEVRSKFNEEKFISNKAPAATDKEPEPPAEDLPVSPTEEELAQQHEALLKKMIAEPESVTLDDLKAVFEKKTDETQTSLIEFLNLAQDPVIISYVTKQIGQSFPNDVVLMAIAPFLRHSDCRIVANTVEGLAFINHPKSFILFTQLLEHPDNRVRSNAALAIGQFDKEKAFSCIKKMLELKDKIHMQASAFHAIKEMKDPQFLPLLLDHLIDPALATETLSVFEVVGGSEALQLLIKTLSDISDPEIKRQISETSNRIIKGNSSPNVHQTTPKKFSPWMV